MRQRLFFLTAYLLLLICADNCPIELVSPQLGLLDLPDDMLSKIVIYASMSNTTQFDPEELFMYARSNDETSELYDLISNYVFIHETIDEIKTRARLYKASDEIKCLLSTSQSIRSKLLNPTITKALLTHFRDEYQTLPLYVATQLRQPSMIHVVDDIDNGLAYWKDHKGLKRNFRGQLREVTSMILADTHDQHWLKKASWLIDQKKHELTDESFALMLDNLVRVYKITDTKSVDFLLDKEPTFKTGILLRFIMEDKEYTNNFIIKLVTRFPYLKDYIAIEYQQKLGL